MGLGVAASTKGDGLPRLEPLSLVVTNPSKS